MIKNALYIQKHFELKKKRNIRYTVQYTNCLQFHNWVTSHRSILGDEFETVYNATQNSLNNINWANEYEADFDYYFEHGWPVTTSTTSAPPPDVFVPEDKPELEEPQVPELPDSASGVLLSVALIASSVFVVIYV